MSPTCCVTGCKSRGTVPPGVLFFQLPLSKPNILTQWLIVLDRRDWIPKAFSRICSLHFLPDDYISKPSEVGRLKPDAIPSVFPDLGCEEEEPVPSPEPKVKVKTEESPKPAGKPKPTPPATPAPESMSQRPRRISKVSSKMKDFILLDDIRKNRHYSPVSQKAAPKPRDIENKAAQELLSILEDSNSISGDESKAPTLKPGTSEVVKLVPAKIIKNKPAPASVKRAKQLEAAQNSPAKAKVVPVRKKENNLKSIIPTEFKQTYFQLKQGDKVLFLTYADLNPVTDMTKNNVLFDDANSISSTDILQPLEAENPDFDSEICNSSLLPEDPPKIEFPKCETPEKKKSPKKLVENDNGVVDINENTTVNDVEVLDVDAKPSDIATRSPITPKVSKDFKLASTVKRKKRFKTVAEIVVRTDNSGEVPSVSIEKMTHLENTEMPKKRSKLSQKQIPHMLNTLVPAAKSEEPHFHISQRIKDAVEKMKEKGKPNPLGYTVLLTSLPPIKDYEKLVLVKRHKETKAEERHELRVVYTSQSGESGSQTQGSAEGDIPVIGAREIIPKEENDESAFGEKRDLIPHPPNGRTVSFDMSANSIVHIDRELPEGAGSAPLQHDHTYITPSSKGGESEIDGDDNSMEGPSKPTKYSNEEIAYRSRALKKIRLLKETVKRKNENINKLKQKVLFIEKALREERKKKKKVRAGFDGSLYEGMLDDDVSKSMEFSMESGELPLGFDENLDDSDEDGRPCRSPITYICEPAIDVCEKPLDQE